MKGIEAFRADPRYGGDGTRVDLAYAVYAVAHGADVEDVRAALRSRDLSHKGNEKRQSDYIERTVRKALVSVAAGEGEMSRRRNVYLKVRLTAEERHRLTAGGAAMGICKTSADFVRASLGKQGELTEEVHSLEKRQAATMTAMRTEIARLQRTEYVLFAMLENLAKTILTYMPPPAAENKASVIAQGRAGLRAVFEGGGDEPAQRVEGRCGKARRIGWLREIREVQTP